MILEPFPYQQSTELRELMMDYFREIDPDKVQEENGQAILDYPYLETYWRDVNRAAFRVVDQKKSIGFALVNDWILCQDYGAQKSIAEFYVCPTHRQQGVGKAVALQLFKTYRTKWEVRRSEHNIIAGHFWRTVVDELTQGNFEERIINDGEDNIVALLFESF